MADDWTGDVDISIPSAARMYDYYLGGSHNFAVDRDAARKVIEAMPTITEVARANRAFLGRAVRYAVGAGVRQFLDIGSGIPTVGNVHEIAQGLAPDTRVVYVDVDPVAVSHARQLLSGNERATAIRADLREGPALLERPELRGVLDPTRPVALLMVSMLQFVPDEEAYPVVRYLTDLLAPGSVLVVSHLAVEGLSAAEWNGGASVYRGTTTPGQHLRDRAGIAQFFDGFKLVDPGLVWLPQWRPEHPDDVGERPERSALLAGVGRRDA